MDAFSGPPALHRLPKPPYQATTLVQPKTPRTPKVAPLRTPTRSVAGRSPKDRGRAESQGGRGSAKSVRPAVRRWFDCLAFFNGPSSAGPNRAPSPTGELKRPCPTAGQLATTRHPGTSKQDSRSGPNLAEIAQRPKPSAGRRTRAAGISVCSEARDASADPLAARRARRRGPIWPHRTTVRRPATAERGGPVWGRDETQAKD